ncbi:MULTISPECIES: sensor histidine kinase [Flavobacterium]|uniref:sensor histidine kinase n=1 Tax=Flavobacterium TaxID=237 RepID=UPI00222597B0|nr:sensor histidine kinase [Flavobacterium sp. N1846]
MRHFWIVFLVWFWIAEVFSQQYYRAETIQFNQGLPSDFVHSTIKKDNYLYIATQRGLCLYDGYEFLKNPKINSQVNFLALSQNQLCYYDHNLGLVQIQDIFSTPQVLSSVNFNDASPNNDHFDYVYVDSKGLIWCSDQNYIKYFSPTTKKITSFLLDKNLIDFESKNTFLEPNLQEVWIATRKGMFIWNRNTKQWKASEHSFLQKNSFQSVKLSANKQNFYFFNDKEEFYVYNISQNKIVFQAKNAFPNKVSSIISSYEKGNQIAIYNENEIFLWNYTQKPTRIYATKNKINHVYYDVDTHFFWVATNHGLVKLIPNDESITSVVAPLKKQQTVTSITNDPTGRIGLCNGDNTFYVYDNSKWYSFISPDTSLEITEVYHYKQSFLLATNKGVYSFRDQKIQELVAVPTGVKKIGIDTNQRIWIVPKKGKILVYDMQKRELQNGWVTNSEKYWQENQFNDIAIAKNGSIWLASWMPKDYGISYYDQSKKQFTEISVLKKFNTDTSFITDYYNRIAFTQQGNILFSGYGGWNLVNPKGKIIHSLNTEKYNVANDHVEGIAEDFNGNIWFTSAEGLNHYNFKTDKVVRISQIDGLASDDLIYGFCKLRPTQIALGTDFGYQVVATDKILKTKLVNKLQISVVKKDGVILAHPNNAITIDYDFTELDIHFSALSFSEKEKIIYKYKFDTDTTWNYIGTNPKLSLVKLAPGKYTITVAVGDNLDNWQSKTLTISLVITPPFYQTFWFMGILTLLILGILYLILRYLVDQEKIKGILKSNIKEAEMQTLRSQMNPHFMFNSLNSINSYIIQNKSNEASKYLTTFSKLMRSILDHSKHRLITIEKELKTLDWYLQLEAVRLEHKFTYSITCSENIDTKTTLIPPLILQPFVENAIWHGIQNKIGPGHIAIVLEQNTSDSYKISITDNGIGRKASAALKKNQTSHKSYGIDITINRLEMLHPGNTISITDLEGEKEQPLGTKVELIISY